MIARIFSSRSPDHTAAAAIFSDARVVPQRMSQPQQQRQLELQSTSVVATTPVIQGAAVCVWDAFGAYWCEGGSHSGRPQSVPPAKPAYLMQKLGQGSSLMYEGFGSKEGFCGCGAEGAGY
jgi:hypothetical protein